MSQSKNDESFKVVDRRMFTAEGDLRPEAVEMEKAGKASPAASAAGAEAVNLAASPGAAPSAPSTLAAERTTAPQTPVVAPEPPTVSLAFQKLVDFLAQNAVVCLGVPDPRTGQAFIDLETARELIDMIEALHEKTRGNLAPDDDRLLAEVIGQLQLTFLDRSQAVAKAQRAKQPGAKP